MESQTVRGTSVNISMVGILFDADRLLQPAKTVVLSFRLPGQKPMINTTGTIVRVDDKQRTAVRFTSMDIRDRQRIRELLADDEV